MLTTSLIIQLALLLITPIVVGVWLNRKLGLSWFLFMGGALAFVVSWMVTILVPAQFNLLVSSVVQMGFLYVIYRFMLNSVKTEREALMVGAGQGGIELIFLGIFAVLSLLQVSQLRSASDNTLASLAAEADEVTEEEVQPERILELRESVDDFWNSPWYGPVVQPIQSFVQALPYHHAPDERLVRLLARAGDVSEENAQSQRVADLRRYIDSFWDTPWYAPVVQPFQALSSLPIQMVLAVVVLGAVTQNRWRPLIGAMSLHLLTRVLPLYGQVVGGVAGWLGLSILFGAGAIWFLKRRWPAVQNQAQVSSDAHAHRTANKRT